MNFERCVKRTARRQYRRGRLSLADYQKVQKASQDPALLAQWEGEVARQLRPAQTDRVRRVDWSAIRQWFIDNWPTILRILLSLLVLLEPAPVVQPTEPEREEESLDELNPLWEDDDDDDNEN